VASLTLADPGLSELVKQAIMKALVATGKVKADDVLRYQALPARTLAGVLAHAGLSP